MENASKALIIAGAILLSILLISLGIMIFTQAQDTVTNSGMSDAEVEAFNNNYTKYEGKQKGTMVKSLINAVLANNSNENNAEKQVTINGSSTPKTSVIKNNITYYVVMENPNGRISNIKVYEGTDETGTEVSFGNTTP